MTCYAQGLGLIPYPGRKEKGKERKKNRSDGSPGCAALNVQKVAEIDIVNRPHTACVHGAVSREGRNPKRRLASHCTDTWELGLEARQPGSRCSLSHCPPSPCPWAEALEPQ